MTSRERRFAMMPCDIDTWDGWTDLEPLEQWLYQLMRRQRDLTQAGVIDLHVSRWAGEARGVTRETVQDLLVSLAAKEYIVVDFDREEALLCWFITTDGVFRKPNPLAAAATAIKHVRSPGIKTVLYNELKVLDESGQVPVPHEPTIRHLIGQLEAHALIGTRQPLHNPSADAPLPVSSGRARIAEPILSGSVIAPEPLCNDSATLAEPGQSIAESGQDNRCTGVPSLMSSLVPVVVPVRDVRPETKDGKTARVVATTLGTALLREHTDQLKPKPPRDVAQRVGEQIDRLLDDSEITPDEIRAGLAMLRANPKFGPGMLPSLVHEYRQVQANPGLANNGGRPPSNSHTPYRNPSDQSAYDTEELRPA